VYFCSCKKQEFLSYFIRICFYFSSILRIVNVTLGQKIVQIINKANGKCLVHDVNGLSVSTQNCGSYPYNEKWSLPDYGYSISYSPYNNMCLDANGRDVYFNTCGKNSYQVWQYDKSVIGTSSTTTIKHPMSSKYLSNDNGIFFSLFEYFFKLIKLSYSSRSSTFI
jgi:hypothetical protein